jgi:hypothetical protein
MIPQVKAATVFVVRDPRQIPLPSQRRSRRGYARRTSRYEDQEPEHAVEEANKYGQHGSDAGRADELLGLRRSKGNLGRIGWLKPNRAQHCFSFIFSFSFLFPLIFESKFEFQICDELVLKFFEYMI